MFDLHIRVDEDTIRSCSVTCLWFMSTWYGEVHVGVLTPSWYVSYCVMTSG